LSELKIQFEDNRTRFGQTLKNTYLKTLNCLQIKNVIAVWIIPVLNRCR